MHRFPVTWIHLGWTLVLGLGLVACGPPSEETSSADAPGQPATEAGSTVVGTTWSWRRLAADDPVEVAHPERYTLRLEADGRYAVRADCNRAAGGYTLEEARLTLEPGPTTLAACGPESLSDRFLSLLGQVESLQLDGDRLTLRLGGEAGALEMLAVAPFSLVGSSWQVRAYNNGRQAVVGLLDGTTITASFGEDGMVTGSAGCNGYRATYEVEDGAITIGRVVSTRKNCPSPEGVMEQEARFLAALESATVIQVDGGRLDLRTAEDELAVHLIAEGAEGP